MKAQSPSLKFTEAVLLNSINPADENYSDMAPLIEKIGNAKVVALGENTHDDGLTFQAKTRLVKFLHQQMGFDVLLFESGMIANWQMNTLIRNDTLMSKAIAYERGNWGKSEYSNSVFEFARQTWKTSRPLELGGFDFDGGQMGPQVIFTFLQSLFNKDPSLKPAQSNWIILDSLIRGFVHLIQPNNLFMKTMTEAAINDGLTQLKNLKTQVLKRKNQLLKRMSLAEYDWTVYALENILISVGNGIGFSAFHRGKQFDGISWNKSRDSIMAERIFWMKENMYKGRKIILWGASGHFMKNSKGFIARGDTVSKWYYYQAGDYLSRKLKHDYYMIAFVYNKGETGRGYTDKKMNDDFGYKETVTSRAPGSFEAIASGLKTPYLFVDLKILPVAHWLRKQVTAYAFGNSKDKADWSKMVDAFFFIETMEPDIIINRKN
jgi:erythromycin esterase